MGFFKKLHNKVTPPDGTLTLNLKSWVVSLGEHLEGSLGLWAKEDYDSTEVRCEIQCVQAVRVIKYVYDQAAKRSLPREETESSVIFAAKPVLSGPTHVYNGETRSFPIKIAIPPTGIPTCHGMDRNATWTIKGVVAVDGRPDAATQAAEVQVLQPATATVGAQVVKEVIREVVKIPCRYCQTLFDQLETSCPNCGAKRTV